MVQHRHPQPASSSVKPAFRKTKKEQCNKGIVESAQHERPILYAGGIFDIMRKRKHARRKHGNAHRNRRSVSTQTQKRRSPETPAEEKLLQNRQDNNNLKDKKHKDRIPAGITPDQLDIGLLRQIHPESLSERLRCIRKRDRDQKDHRPRFEGKAEILHALAIRRLLPELPILCRGS